MSPGLELRVLKGGGIRVTRWNLLALFCTKAVVKSPSQMPSNASFVARMMKGLAVATVASLSLVIAFGLHPADGASLKQLSAFAPQLGLRFGLGGRARLHAFSPRVRSEGAGFLLGPKMVMTNDDRRSADATIDIEDGFAGSVMGNEISGLSVSHDGEDSEDMNDQEYNDSEDSEERDPGDVRNFPISAETLDALAARGITKLFPVQYCTFNEIYSGRDVLARARTGTGKTLGFSLPIIERIIADKVSEDTPRRGRGRNPVCVVLSPTRELAQQVEREIEALTAHSRTRVSTLCVYGGVSYQKQEQELRNGVDLVVGTPGRMIDLMKNGMLDLSEISYLVLDEADEMLNR